MVTMNTYNYAAAGLSVVFVALLLFLRWKWRSAKRDEAELVTFEGPAQLVHKMPSPAALQNFEVQQKDSLDEHLDVLTKKLAEKEGRLRLSRSKIRETQHEIESLHPIDQEVRSKYRDIMDSLRQDLTHNEKECKKLQEQIEWVSRRRAELKEEVRLGQRLYGEAAAELANNLIELQRGRTSIARVTDKPQDPPSETTLRHRKEPDLPHGSVTTVSEKASPQTTQAVPNPRTEPRI